MMVSLVVSQNMWMMLKKEKSDMKLLMMYETRLCLMQNHEYWFDLHVLEMRKLELMVFLFQALQHSFFFVDDEIFVMYLTCWLLLVKVI